MSTVKLTCFNNDTFRSNRTADLATANIRERSKRLSSSYQHRRGTLSPLHLPHETLSNLEFKGLSIGLMRLQSRGTPLIQDEPIEFTPPPPEKLGFLSNHYNFAEHRRLSARFDFNKMKKVKRDRMSSEKYSVLAKNIRFAGRSPVKSNVIKGLLPKTRARMRSDFNEKDIRLRISGVMKCFSPRGSIVALDPALNTFKK